VDAIAARRRLLVTLDLLQLPVIASVPLAHAFHDLTLSQLYAVAATSGLLGGVSAIAVPAFVPEVVPADRLVPANAKLAGARSVGQIAGPGLAAALIQNVGAAAAMTADAVSYGLSSLALLLPRPAGNAQRPSGSRPGLLQSLRAGWGAVRARPGLARLAVAAAALNLGGGGLGGLYAYFVYHVLHLSPAQVGVTFSAYSVAAVGAVLVTKRVVARLGLARVIPVFGPVAAATLFLIPAAVLLPALPALLVYELAFGFCATVWAIASVTLQQLLSPPDQLGRVLGLSRSIGLLVVPVGSLLGGVLAGALGTIPTLVAFAAVALLGTLAAVRVRPAAVEEPSSAANEGSR
jgi:MFS family permease